MLPLLVSACQPYGCHPGWSSASDAARDRGVFDAALLADVKFKGMRATAVHGHEVDVIDTTRGPDRRTAFITQDRHTGKYTQLGGIGLDLLSAWHDTFVRLHPRAFWGDAVSVDFLESPGTFTISSHDCATL